MDINPDIIGTVAASLTTICFVPQVLQVIKNRETAGISTPMYILFSIGVCFWLAYGIMLMRAPIIICNVLTLILSITILVLKVKIDRENEYFK